MYFNNQFIITFGNFFLSRSHLVKVLSINDIEIYYVMPDYMN